MADDAGHQAASDRPRDLHSLQHLRGDLPGRRDHARLRAITWSMRTSASTAWPACRPAPRAAIDNWRTMPRAKAYSVAEQFGWDELPIRSERLRNCRRRGCAPSAPASERADEAPCRWRRQRRGVFNGRRTAPRCRPGRPRMPTRICMAPRRRRNRHRDGGRQRARHRDRHGLRHASHRAGLRRSALPGTRRAERSASCRPARTKTAVRIARASIPSRARATASGRATTTFRLPSSACCTITKATRYAAWPATTCAT